jgi:hypothetical protein
MTNRKETIDDLIKASEKIDHYHRESKEHGIKMPSQQITTPYGHHIYTTTTTPNDNDIKRGKWTAEEDHIIIREINNNGNNFAARSSDQLEGRDAASVFNRWHKVLKYNTDNFGLLPKDYTPEQRKQHIEIYGNIVKYTPSEKKQAIERWKKKREGRNAVQMIKYKGRQNDANARTRVKGRFVPKGGKTNKRRWSLKYKRSINCKKPKGFSQKQYCKRKCKKHLTRRRK